MASARATALERERECRNSVRERQLCSGDVDFVTWHSSSYIMCAGRLCENHPFKMRRIISTDISLSHYSSSVAVLKYLFFWQYFALHAGSYLIAFIIQKTITASYNFKSKCIFRLLLPIKKNLLELQSAQKCLLSFSREVWTGAVEGIRELHSQNIVHMDIKPENFVVKDGVTKVENTHLKLGIPRYILQGVLYVRNV